MSRSVRAELGPLEEAVRLRLEALDRQRAIPRIWEHDPTLWAGTPDTPELADRLGWLNPFRETEAELHRCHERMTQLREAADLVLLLGMGGSSLAPEVMVQVLSPTTSAFRMLDSTAAAAVRAAAPLDPGRTLVLASSKSGGTLETRSLLDHFWDTAHGQGARFGVVTDPGSSLGALARQRGFDLVAEGLPEVGGRFSALTVFGLVPATLAGLPVEEILRRASLAARESHRSHAEENPGGWLGAVLGEGARQGRDKLTLILSPRFRSFGLWAEQLVAESTGKGGQGILPVLAPTGTDPARWGGDRLVLGLRLAGEARSPVLDHAEGAGFPVVEIVLEDPEELGGEFYRWELATAVAGHILGVNPFDQPSVAMAKANTTAVLEGKKRADIAPAGTTELDALVAGVRPGDYVGLLVYAAPSAALDERLDRAALELERRTRVPVTWGYGPRYLHSTGQLHKGGPATGHFVQIVETTGADLPVPERPYGFDGILRAQADGDLLALREAVGRPCLRLAGLDALPGA